MLQALLHVTCHVNGKESYYPSYNLFDIKNYVIDNWFFDIIVMIYILYKNKTLSYRKHKTENIVHDQFKLKAK